MSKQPTDLKTSGIEEEETKATELSNLGSLEIANIIKTSQTQNGLKHGDYKRYHHYCSQRLKRIRKVLKYSHGSKYQNKKRVDEACPNDPSMLHSLLYHSERLWAFGMNLKQGLSNQVKGKENRRTKFVIRKKFKKAAFWAGLLEKICQTRTEKKTSFEAEAYAEYLKAIYAFEVEKWEEALNSFVKSRQICTQLIKISDAIQSLVYQEKIDQIDQAIRYCNYKLNKGGKMISLEEILELRNKTQDPALTAKIDALLEENRQKVLESKGALEIEYHGEKLPIKNEKVVLLLQKIEEIEMNIRNLDKSKIELEGKEAGLSNVEERLSMYIEIFSYYEEAIILLTKEKDESKDSEGKQKILLKIINYLNVVRYERYIDRNALQLRVARKKFGLEKGLNNLLNLQARKLQKQKTVTPFEIVRWCDNLLQVFKQIMELEKLNPDLSRYKKYDLLEGFYQSMRCFYVSCIYFSQRKFTESLSLLIYCEKNLNSLQPDLKSKNLQNQLGELEEVMVDMKDLRIRNLASFKDAQIKEENSVLQKIDELNVDGKTLLNNSMENMLKNPALKHHVSKENALTIPIVEFPPKMQTIGCKPIFFDLGFGLLKYPNIANIEKKIKEEKQGFFKSALNRFNIFRR